jgi:hypothetical protein
MLAELSLLLWSRQPTKALVFLDGAAADQRWFGAICRREQRVFAVGSTRA